MDLKSSIINQIIKTEGGYVNNPSDSGEETNFGIIRKTARENNYTGHMDKMPRSVAFDIYAKKYWHSVNGDALLALSEPVAAEVVDAAVLVGPGMAGYFLQRSLNVLNRCESIYPDISIDRVVGSKTIASLKAYLAARDLDVLMGMLNTLQGAFLVELAERRGKDEEFIYGQFKKRVISDDSGGGVPPKPIKPKSGGGVPPKPSEPKSGGTVRDLNVKHSH